MVSTSDVTAAHAAAPVKSAPEQSAQKGVITSDFETFLRMLTTQMQNQDPLEPMKSDELSVQLATFSGVEQQVLTNDLLTGLNAKLGAGGMAEFAGWVGKDARAAAPAYFDGAAPVQIVAQRATGADRAEVVLRDSGGAEVARLPVVTSGEILVWDGRKGGGAALPAGLYSMTTESFAGDELIDKSPAETYARVTEARVENGAVLVVMNGGVKVPAGKVTALREAASLP